MKKDRNKSALAAGIALALAASTAAAQETLEVETHQITFTPLYDSTPTLGNDGVSDLVVYTSRELLPNGFFDEGDILYHRLNADGSPSGIPIGVTSGLTDDRLQDTWGDYIVYTEYVSVASSTGRIMLYRISTASAQPLTDPLLVQEARIHGDIVVWVQASSSGSLEIMLYDLDWLGTTHAPLALTGPIPMVFNVDIGERYVVWTELNVDRDIGAYDLTTDVRYKLTDTNIIDERHPATSGDWIVWESRDHGAPSKRIEIVNLSTGDYRVVVDDGSVAARPSIYGKLVVYESDLTGIFDLYAYRIDTRRTFALPPGAGHRYLNDVFGKRLAYVQLPIGDEDVFVAKLNFRKTRRADKPVWAPPRKLP